MDIFNGLERYKNMPGSHIKDPEPRKPEEVDDEPKSKWAKIKDYSLMTLGCLIVIAFFAGMVGLPILWDSISSNFSGDNSEFFLGAILIIGGIIFLSVLFYGVWKIVIKNISPNKTKRERILTIIATYIIVILLLVLIVYLISLIGDGGRVNDAHFGRE